MEEQRLQGEVITSESLEDISLLEDKLENEWRGDSVWRRKTERTTREGGKTIIDLTEDFFKVRNLKQI
jgi:hypothetical protein